MSTSTNLPEGSLTERNDSKSRESERKENTNDTSPQYEKGMPENADKKEKESKVWKNFKKNENDITCLKCQKKFSKNTGTSSLDRHYESFHTEAENDKTQPKISGFLKSSLHFKKETADQLLVDWILMSGQPFSVVDEPPFKNFVLCLNPQYKVPCRKTLKSQIEKEFEIEKKSVKGLLQTNSSFISLTIDEWSSVNMESYMGITAHFIDATWNLRRLVLDIDLLPHPHTGESIAIWLIDKLTEFQIEKRILSITTDNAANIQVACRVFFAKMKDTKKEVLGFHNRCMAHCLNLVVQKSLKIYEENEGIIQKIRTFFTKIHKSSVLTEALQTIIEKAKEKYIKPRLDVITRWNSTYLMLERAQKLKKFLKILEVENDDLPQIPNSQWKELDEIVVILEPFYFATEAFSISQFPSICEAITILQSLEDHLQAIPKESCTYTLGKNLLDNLQATREKFNVCTILGTLLDPRLKMIPLQNEKNYKDLLKQAKELYISQYINQIVALPPPSENDMPQKDERNEKKQGEQSQNGSLPQESNLHNDMPKVADNPETNKNPFTKFACKILQKVKQEKTEENKEFDDYLECNISNSSISILDWWRSHENEFPTVQKMARDFLSIPASSTPCEELFSEAGNALIKRTTLKPHMLRKILCLKSWKKLE